MEDKLLVILSSRSKLHIISNLCSQILEVFPVKNNQYLDAEDELSISHKSLEQFSHLISLVEMTLKISKELSARSVEDLDSISSVADKLKAVKQTIGFQFKKVVANPSDSVMWKVLANQMMSLFKDTIELLYLVKKTEEKELWHLVQNVRESLKKLSTTKEQVNICELKEVYQLLTKLLILGDRYHKDLTLKVHQYQMKVALLFLQSSGIFLAKILKLLPHFTGCAHSKVLEELSIPTGIIDVLHENDQVQEIVKFSMAVAHLLKGVTKERIAQSCHRVLQQRTILLMYQQSDVSVCELPVDSFDGERETLLEEIEMLERHVNEGILRLIAVIFTETTEPLDRMLGVAFEIGKLQSCAKKDELINMKSVHEPFFTALEHLIQEFIRHADSMYQVSRFVVGCSTDTPGLQSVLTCIKMLELLDPEVVPLTVSYVKEFTSDTLVSLQLLQEEWHKQVKNLIASIIQVSDTQVFIDVLDVLIKQSFETLVDFIHDRNREQLKVLAKTMTGKAELVAEVFMLVIEDAQKSGKCKDQPALLNNLKSAIKSVHTLRHELAEDMTEPSIQEKLKKKAKVMQQMVSMIRESCTTLQHGRNIHTTRRKRSTCSLLGQNTVNPLTATTACSPGIDGLPVDTENEESSCKETFNFDFTEILEAQKGEQSTFNAPNTDVSLLIRAVFNPPVVPTLNNSTLMDNLATSRRERRSRLFSSSPSLRTTNAELSLRRSILNKNKPVDAASDTLGIVKTVQKNLQQLINSEDIVQY
ncbi:uncharacterized protein LOC143233694 isoform X2 [Tachypleus tridentatus]|uniref:uncharacterized protein LOC143233694 isoform X2 n=1 Tax=Tachypleus tridentatus TaxID=6853 RepID=UPI003FCF7357